MNRERWGSESWQDRFAELEEWRDELDAWRGRVDDELAEMRGHVDEWVPYLRRLRDAALARKLLSSAFVRTVGVLVSCAAIGGFILQLLRQ